MSNLLQNMLGQDDYVYLRREYIRPDPNQDRRDWTSPERIAYLETLAAGMATIVDGKKYGVREPLIVIKVGHNDYLIIAGESRWRASGLADIELLPCIVRSEQTGAATLSLEALTSNIQRNNLSTWELANALQKRIKGDPDNNVPPMSYDQLVEVLDRSKSWISKYTAVLNMADDVQALCRDRLVENVNTLRDLNAYAPEDQAKAIAEIRAGNNANELVQTKKPPKKTRAVKSQSGNEPLDNAQENQASERIDLSITKDQAIGLLARLGIYNTEESQQALKEQLMAQITGVTTYGSESPNL